MKTMTAVRRTLISVSDKTGLASLAQFLADAGAEIISTGGTAAALTEVGLRVTPVSGLTGYPELLDGRVKTLHPAIAAAILADGPAHETELTRHGIAPIDLVVVNLYPFEQAAAHVSTLDELIEWIDIGGVTLLRAAAKNWRRVGVVCDPSQYKEVMDELRRDGALSTDTRRRLAARAFARTAAYDAAIAERLSAFSTGSSDESADRFPENLVLSYRRAAALRYGENPHQAAALYLQSSPPAGEVATATLLQGKPLSYNNLVDLDAAWAAVREFKVPAAVIIKHATPCGAALGVDIAGTIERAIDADNQSAFGGILAVNGRFDEDAVGALGSLFLEAIIAPELTSGARERLASRKNLRILEAAATFNPATPNGAGTRPGRPVGFVLRSLPGGLLVQEADATGVPSSPQVVTRRTPTLEELRDLNFAWLVCKHVRSNAIVLARREQTVGIGAGQMSRVDSVRISIAKADERASGSVMASDGFFPFADGLEAAIAAGVTAVIQPGGSVRDQEIIAAADAAEIAMVFAGERHFWH